MFVLWLTFLIIFLSYYFIKSRYAFNAVKCFKGTGKTLPVIGDLHLIIRKDMNQIAKWLLEISKDESATIKFWMSTKLFVISTKPEDIQTILTSPHCFLKPPVYDVIPGAKYGLVTSKPNIWRPLRRALDPSFNLQIVKATFPKLKTSSELLVSDLKSYVGKGEFNFKEPLLLRVIDSALRASYGFVVEDISILQLIKSENYDSMVATAQKIRFHFIQVLLSPFKSSVEKPAAISYEKLREVLNEAAQNTKQNIEGKEQDAYLDQTLKNKSNNFFNHLCHMLVTKTITTREFEDILITTFVNGTDTTAIAVANAIMCLAIFPDIQEKLYKEISKHLDSTNENDYDTVNALEYLDCVLKESLRFLPSAPIFSRIATNDIVLSDGIVPNGTEIFILADNVHKNKQIWGPAADKFNPDNFLSDESMKRHPCSFIPFSYGPRNCIASRLAQAIIKDFIVKLVLNYRFSTKLQIDDLEFNYSLTAQLQPTYLVLVEERTK